MDTREAAKQILNGENPKDVLEQGRVVMDMAEFKRQLFRIIEEDTEFEVQSETRSGPSNLTTELQLEGPNGTEWLLQFYKQRGEIILSAPNQDGDNKLIAGSVGEGITSEQDIVDFLNRVFQ